jgi:DNA-binding protein H-NS
MLNELLEQRNHIDAQIEAVRSALRNDVLVQARGLIALHELTVDELFPTARKSTMKSAARKVAPKYRDPATGRLWTGRGRSPTWFDAARAQEFTL